MIDSPSQSAETSAEAPSAPPAETSAEAPSAPRYVLIARAGDPAQRIFPPISPRLYEQRETATDLTPDQQTARDVLALAHKGFTRWQRLAGWQLDAAGRLGRMLMLHHLAITAELASQPQRADFFWRETLIQLRKLARQDTIWSTLAGLLAEPGTMLSDPAQLRQRLVDEILIDTHCAFYNGWLQRAEKCMPEDRAFAHLNYIQKLLPWSALSAEDQRSLVIPALTSQIKVCESAAQWPQAIAATKTLLTYAPDNADYQAWLAQHHVASTLARVGKRTTEAAETSDARTLERGVDQLEKLCQTYPYNLALYNMLGQLHHLHAIKLANAGFFARALVAAQAALTHSPSADVQTTRDELIQTMEKLQAQMKAIRAQLAGRRNVRLNAKGTRLQAEAMKGFELFNAYVKSSDVERITQARRNATNRSVWLRVGLAEPGERWDEQAQVLLENMNAVVEQQPEDSAAVATAWDALVAENSALADLDRAPILAFLERHLFGAAVATPAPQPPVEPANPPLLTPADSPRRRKREPSGYWWFSRQDLSAKALASIALIAILAVSIMTIGDFQARAARNAVYPQIKAAAERGDYPGVIDAAETFFANRPWGGQDGRDQQVASWYSEAIIRLFIDRPGELSAETLTHLQRYHTLLGTMPKGEAQQ